MSFKDKSVKIRALALFMAVLVFVGTLCSCSSNPKKSSGEELRSVGSVGEYEVAYEEIYFLANSYIYGLENKYGEYDSLDAKTAKEFDAELTELVYSYVISNYAIMTLCEKNGLEYDKSKLSERVQEYIDQMIVSDFGSSASKYRDWLREYYLTDNYLRFTVSVDLLYSDLLTKLLIDGKIIDDDEVVEGIIKDTFIRTRHIMIANDKGEDVEENRRKAEKALSKYRNGSMTMYDLIGSSYNEDLSLTDLDGFYFALGSMEEEYEKAAVELEVGEVSEVIESRGTNSKGENVTCFYIIQRLALEQEHIERNFVELEQKYRDSVVYGMLEETKKELVFIPNDYCSSLNLSKLEAPKPYSPIGTIITVCVCSVLVIGGAVWAVSVYKKKKKSSKTALQEQ